MTLNFLKPKLPEAAQPTPAPVPLTVVPIPAPAAPVDADPTASDPADDTETEPESRTAYVSRVATQTLTCGAVEAWRLYSDWVKVAEISDDQLRVAVEKERRNHRAKSLKDARGEVARARNAVREAEVDAATAMHAPDREDGQRFRNRGMHHDTAAVLEARGRLASAQIHLAHLEEETGELAEVTDQDVSRARTKRRLVRAGITAAALYGAWTFGSPHPELLLLAVPVVLMVLLELGRRTKRRQSSDTAPEPDKEDSPAAVPGEPVAPIFPVQVVNDPTPPPVDQAVWVTDALKECGITGAKVLTVSNRPWGALIDLELPRGARALNEKLVDVEAAMRLRIGGLSFMVNPADAGIISLRIVRSDPFGGLGAPFHHKPLSLTVRKPLNFGLEMDGSVFAVGMERVHGALVGGSGSGKSSALWTIIDSLSACEDVVLMGIDLTGAPALMAWGDVIQELATEAEDAEELLQRLVKMGRGRCTDLGERSRPKLGQPLPDLKSENWVPTAKAPQIVLIVDEYPTLVEAGLWPYVATLLKIARKGALTVLLASQRATQAELGSTTVKAQLGFMGMLACDPNDVQQLLGPGMRAKGWTPDRLQPALGDDANDAGVVYGYGGKHIVPVPKKFYRLTLSEVHKRALERMAAGLPRIDAATLAYAQEDGAVALELDALGTDQDHEGEPLTADQERLIKDVVDALAAARATRAHIRTLAAALADADPARYGAWTATELGAALRDAGVEVAPKLNIAKKVTTGVRLDDLIRRLNAVPEPATA